MGPRGARLWQEVMREWSPETGAGVQAYHINNKLKPKVPGVEALEVSWGPLPAPRGAMPGARGREAVRTRGLNQDSQVRMKT